MRAWLRALICYSALTYERHLLIVAGFPTFADWYGRHLSSGFIKEHFKLYRFVGVFGLTFSILIPFALLGFWSAMKERIQTTHLSAKIAALLIASLPAFLWTESISRILYIQFLIMVPLALWGVAELLRYVPEQFQTRVKHGLYLLLVATSFVLFTIAGKESLFTVLF